MKMLHKWVLLAGAMVLLSLSGAAFAQPKDKVVLMLNWYLYS